ncbi:MAG: SDR family oxidoreductase [Myxococcaceae bacterium]|jgi:NAD(P)-dependent dehydrogenase (short-subunit alcohol dehydrogenase family)|nr:SDR family oxidoreductase [Myxococcaceae bacterium]
MALHFREGQFSGRHVFVTGGSSGINLRLAEAFGRAGAKVSILGRKQEKLDAALALLKSQGTTAQAFSADVRDYAAVDGALTKAVEAFGALDVLVCGAAGNFPAPAMAMSSNGFKAVLDIDVLGTFNACRAAFEKFKTPGASVINISAPQASVAYPMQSHVCAAKAGVDMLTRTLAMEWGGAGIRVNSISPGPIDETEGMSRLAGDADARKKVEATVPLQRLGTKDDIANLALFLASDAASYVTGSVYACDGGMQLMGGTFMQL